MRDIFYVSVGSDGQSQKTVSTNHNHLLFYSSDFLLDFAVLLRSLTTHMLHVIVNDCEDSPFIACIFNIIEVVTWKCYLLVAICKCSCHNNSNDDDDDDDNNNNNNNNTTHTHTHTHTHTPRNNNTPQ